MSLIEAMATRYRENLAKSRAFSGASPVASSIVEDATMLMDATAFIKPSTDREALIQASFLLHLMLDHVDDDQGPPMHALAHQIVRFLAARAQVSEDEINAWFRSDRPDARLLGEDPSEFVTAGQQAMA